jgi:protein gp37
MSAKSKIEWTERTWNVVTGCHEVSPGCDHCYAKTFAERWRGVAGHAFQNGFDLTLRPERLAQPRSWRKPSVVFVNSMSDLFHKDVPDDFIARVFLEMLTPYGHTYQVLTKRPERMRRIVRKIYENGFTQIHFDEKIAFEDRVEKHIWLGVSIESNEYAWRADMLRETPAAVRFLSVEPMLGPIDKVDLAGIDWVIVGGESGPGARPMHSRWALDVRNRCEAHGIPFFFKQWGAWRVCDRDRATHLLHADGRFVDRAGATTRIRRDNGTVLEEDLIDRYHPGWERVRRFGKTEAGRLLSGREYSEMPR